jgi:hypothetical protein
LTTVRRQENKYVVYTDIIGHTRMIGRIGTAFRAMRERHDALFTDAVKAVAPTALVKGTGDGFYAAFDDVSGALETALAFKYGLSTEDWMRFLPPEKRTPDNLVKCRIGVHTGLVSIAYEGDKPVDFDGQPRVVTEKVMSSAAANQILISRVVRDEAMRNFIRREEIKVVKFGEYKFRDVENTVEVWAVADDEAGLGPKPAQATEHRVIVFAVIENHVGLSESGGVAFAEAKEHWDRTFDRVVSEHAQDAFVKRMPEGSLGAFRTAIEAVRIARDFRRALKAASAGAPVVLAPRIGLDSGLVTFDYLDNRPADVRDQPVNVAAKVAKVDKPPLCAPWQTMLTRPVREDAYANLKERDEYKWVCVGRKNVPGEPEPIELWDFQDSQTKSDSRTVLWIDAARIRKSAGPASEGWRSFSARLRQLADEVFAARPEAPWIIPTETGLAAAFSNHVEAVAAADELRKAAATEAWEKFPTNYSRSGRDDNLLVLALSMGPVRVQYEDGQIKDLKGEAVDSVKAVAALASNGQLLVSRGVMDAVATAFPEAEVKWKRVEGGSKTDPEAFEFVRVTKKHSSTRGILIGSSIAGVAVIAAIVGVTMFGGPRQIQRAAGDVKPLVAGLQTLAPDDTARAFIDKLVEVYNQRDLDLQKQDMVLVDRNKKLEDELAPFKQLVQAWADRFDARAVADARPALDAVKDVPSLATWVEGLSRFEVAQGESPIAAARGQWLQQIANLTGNLNAANLSASPLTKQLADLRARIETARQKPWVEANRTAIEAEAKAIDAEIGPKGTLVAAVDAAYAEWEKANVGAAEAEAKRRAAAAQASSGLSAEVLEPIYSAAGPGQPAVLRAAGSKAETLATSASGSPAEKEQAVKPLSDALARLNKAVRQYDFASAAESVTPAIEAATTPAALVEALAKLESFRRLDTDPRRDEEWGRSIEEARTTLRRERAASPEIEAQLTAIEKQISDLRAIPLTVANQAKLVEGAKAVADALSAEGAMQKAVASAIAKAKEELNKGRAAAQQNAEIQAEVDRILAQATVAGADQPGLTALWKRARDGVQASTIDAPAKRDQLNAWQAAIVEAGKQFPAPPAPPAGAPRSRVALVAAADEARSAALTQLATTYTGQDPAGLAPAAEAASTQFQSTLKAIDALGDQLSSLEQGLNQGLLPADEATAGQTLAQLAAKVRGDELLKQPAIQSAAAPVLGRVDELARIASSEDLSALLTLAQNAPASTPEVVVAVWDRLGSVPGVAEPAWLTAQRDVAAKLESLPPTITAERRKQLSDAILAAKPERWLRHIEATGNETALINARGLQTRMGVTDAILARMSPAAQYNWAVLDLREAANKAGDEAALRAVAQRVIDAGNKSGDPKAQQAAAQLTEALAGNVVSAAAAAGELPLAQAGPGAVGWKLADQAGDSVTYEMVLPEGKRDFYPPQPAPRITFIRVASAQPTGSIYLATTAASVGQTFTIIDALGDWATARSATSESTLDLPASWRRGSERLELTLQGGAPIWSPKTGLVDQYLEGVTMTAPNLNTPMQYVSPRLALYTARLVNCRLPSESEWRAGLQADGGAGNLSAFNLRDQSIAPVLNRKPPGVVTRIDNRVFPSAPKADAHPFNDGVPLFTDVDKPLPGAANRRFRHLIGNVAQLLMQDPDRVNDLPAAEAVGWVGRNPGAFSIIGGSALSEVADETKLTTARPIPEAQVARLNANRGWADVGFRLSFSTTRPAEAPGEKPSLAEALRSVSRALPFIQPKAG